MRIVLKFNEPLAKTYQHHGFQTGILLGDKECLDWLYTKYIQIYFNKKLMRMDYNQSYFFKGENVFTNSYYMIPYDFCINYNIVSFIKQFINEGYYVIGNWNEYFISEKKAYQQHDIIHNFIIYGYDERRQKLMSVGYTKDGHWNYFEVFYQEFMNAVLYERNSDIYIEFLSTNKFFEEIFNIDVIKEQLNEYLNSKDVIYEQEICHGGLKACHEYLNYINQVISNGGVIQKESAYLLKEHKMIMLDRLQHLKSRGIIHVSNCLIDDYKEVLTIFTKFFNIVLKYMISGKKSLGEKIFELGNIGLDKEEKILNFLVKKEL